MTTSKYKCNRSHTEVQIAQLGQICVGCLNTLYARHERMLDFIKKIADGEIEMIRNLRRIGFSETHTQIYAKELLQELQL